MSSRSAGMLQGSAAAGMPSTIDGPSISLLGASNAPSLTTGGAFSPSPQAGAPTASATNAPQLRTVRPVVIASPRRRDLAKATVGRPAPQRGVIALGTGQERAHREDAPGSGKWRDGNPTEP